MLGIIGAMPAETEIILNAAEDKCSEIISGMNFCKCKIFKKDVVVSLSGVGKVNAAAAAQTMILKYSPASIINIGVAGGLDADLEIGDTVIASSVVEHDMDTSGVGDPVGYISGLNTVYIKSDTDMSTELLKIAKKYGRAKSGIIASGDKFVCTENDRSRIKKLFNASAAEMEGAAIGHICAMNNVKFSVLRAISDGANSNSHMDFAEFTQLAAKNSSRILLDYIQNM